MKRMLAFATIALLASACGDGQATPAQDVAPPARVSEALVPETLGRGDLGVYLYTGEEAKEAFANAGDNALIADGKLWEIRQGDQLVGVLQISTVKRRVDLFKEDHRKAVLGILAGGTKRVEIEDVTVTYTETEDQVKYVWFGEEMFQVLTLKTSKVEPEPILKELIAFQREQPGWRALPSPTPEDD